MMLRIRSRDGFERITVPNPNITISDLKTFIQTQLNVPIPQQTLSMNQNLLLSKQPTSQFSDMSNPTTPISSLGLSHGSIVYLSYAGERSVAGAPKFAPAGSFGRKMTMDELIAKQARIERQESAHCNAVSFDRDAANVFQRYVNDDLVFAIKRGGFMYGIVNGDGSVSVEFIYEPPQQGSEDNLMLLRDAEEEKRVEGIAAGFGMRRIGFIFAQTVGQAKGDYTMSNSEVRMAAELHGESELKEWVTAIVKLEVNEDGGADVHFEAFQMSDQCVKLFKEGWFEENCEGIDPKLTRMKKDVVILGKDTRDVDNDFFLVVVKILDHQGPLSTNFPIENRGNAVPLRALKSHLDRTKGLSFAKRISDFHLLLLLARYLDQNADIPILTECIKNKTSVPEGYELLIDSLANAGAH